MKSIEEVDLVADEIYREHDLDGFVGTKNAGVIKSALTLAYVKGRGEVIEERLAELERRAASSIN